MCRSRLVAICRYVIFSAAVLGQAATSPSEEPPSTPPGFTPAGNEFSFDTGQLRGTLRGQGRTLGVTKLVDASSNTDVAGAYGLLSPYRLLTSAARFGHAAWDWSSTARRLPDGAVEVRWQADAEHPLELAAVYRWSKPDSLDVELRVTPRQDLPKFELFLASYFRGFDQAAAYVQPCAETNQKSAFLAATKESGVWQMFPRDEEAVRLIGDGRWKRPPNPVDWVIRPRLAAPLAIRRDAATGLTALVMAKPGDGFAVSMPFGEEGHRSLYLSLFGRDLVHDQPATARARLIVGQAITDQRAVEVYQRFAAEP